LQTPQRLVSAKCSTGTRFFVPQDPQRDTIEKAMRTPTSRVNFEHSTGHECPLSARRRKPE
jgi:hypothetical protein